MGKIVILDIVQKFQIYLRIMEISRDLGVNFKFLLSSLIEIGNSKVYFMLFLMKNGNTVQNYAKRNSFQKIDKGL